MKRCLILHVCSDPALFRSRRDILQRWNTIDCTPRTAIPALYDHDLDLAILCDSIGTVGQGRLVRYIGIHFPTMPIVLVADLKIVQSSCVHAVAPRHLGDLQRKLEQLLEQGHAAA